MCVCWGRGVVCVFFFFFWGGGGGGGPVTLSHSMLAAYCGVFGAVGHLERALKLDLWIC